MSRITLFIASLVALGVVWLAASGPSRAAPTAASACDVWTHEPLVAWDVTGETLAGPFDVSLHVYNDGVVKHFSASHGKAALVYVDPAEARTLARDLFLAGAFALCDQPDAGADLPLKTLTLYRGKADALTHTVNWWSDDPPFGAVEGILNAFIATHLP